MTDPLAAHSVTMQDTTRFLSTGGTQRITKVTYWLGRHGPFELIYPLGQATAVEINADIQKRKTELALVMGATPQP